MIINEKNLIRKSAVLRRDSLAKDEIREKREAIIGRLEALDEFREGSFIMCYINFRSEVETYGFVKWCLINGKRIAVPLVVRAAGGRGGIVACEIEDPDRDLRPGSYGIFETVKGRASLVKPEEFDMIVVPGVAFDENRNRLGYGAGYYDGFLAETGDCCTKAGLAFEVQLLERIPAEDHDIPMDMILTEDRIIRRPQ